MVVLKGNSGSGKSTLLALLAGLDQPTRGRLTVAGRDLSTASQTELTEFRRRVVGMVFQSFNLLPTLSVLENVCLPALLAGRARAHTLRKAEELLRWLNLEQRLHHFPAHLSGGEMQRTAIARALINDPRISLTGLNSVPRPLPFAPAGYSLPVRPLPPVSWWVVPVIPWFM